MFKPYNPTQIALIPASFVDFLGEGHKAVILSEIIDTLDCSLLLGSYENSVRGTSAFHPVMLTKLLFWGYMNRTFSSRRLAEKTQSDLAYMYLCGSNQPDFRTIARFRTEKGDLLTPLFAQIVTKAEELGLVSFNIVSIDGTKIYADASRHKNLDPIILEKQMQKVIEETKKLDEIEDEKCGHDDDGSGIPADMKTQTARDEKRHKITEQKKILEQKQLLEQKKEAIAAKQTFAQQEIERHKQGNVAMARINTTDPDSRMMQMKKKDWGNGYNPQIATENQFILTTTLGNAASDIRELIPVLDQLENTYNRKPKVTLADKGFASEDNYDYLSKKEIDGYIPHPTLQGNMSQCTYNEQNDTYRDPDGNVYTFKQYMGSRTPRKRGRQKACKDTGTEAGTGIGKSIQDITETKESKEAAFKGKIYQTKTKDGTNKFLKISKNWLNHCKQQDEKLSTPEGKALYEKRCYSVEPAFGNIKRNLGFERFSLRGLKKVTIEWNLITMAHNMTKLILAMAT